MASGDASWLSWLNIAPEENSGSNSNGQPFNFLSSSSNTTNADNLLSDFANPSPSTFGSGLPAELELWSNVTFDTSSGGHGTHSASHSPAALPERDLSKSSSMDKSATSPVDPSPYAKRPFGRYDHQQYHAHLEKGFNAFTATTGNGQQGQGQGQHQTSSSVGNGTESFQLGPGGGAGQSFLDQHPLFSAGHLGLAAQDGSNTLFATSPRQINSPHNTNVIQENSIHTQTFPSSKKRDIPVDFAPSGSTASSSSSSKRQNVGSTASPQAVWNLNTSAPNSPFTHPSPTQAKSTSTATKDSGVQPPSSSTPASTPELVNGSLAANSPAPSSTFVVGKNQPLLTKAAILAAQRDELQRIKTLSAEEEQARQAELSRIAVEDDKRRRNTAASARFRVKKKAREQALEETIKELQGKMDKLEKDLEASRIENNFLRDLVIRKVGLVDLPTGPTAAGASSSL